MLEIFSSTISAVMGDRLYLYSVPSPRLSPVPLFSFDIFFGGARERFIRSVYVTITTQCIATTHIKYMYVLCSMIEFGSMFGIFFVCVSFDI